MKAFFALLISLAAISFNASAQTEEVEFGVLLCNATGAESQIKVPLPFKFMGEMQRGRLYTFPVKGTFVLNNQGARTAMPFETNFQMRLSDSNSIDVEAEFNIFNPFLNAQEAPIHQKSMLYTEVNLLKNRLRTPGDFGFRIEPGDVLGATIICMPIL